MPAYTVDEIRQIVAARQEKGGEGEFAADDVLLRKLDEATKSSLYENFTVQPLNAEYPQDAVIDYQFRRVTGQSSNIFDTDCYGLVLHATGPTHKLGGTLDAVISHSVTGCPSCVAAEDVGLSDHYLLRWEVSTTRAAVPTTSICCRPWRRLDIEHLRSELLASRLCRSDDWPSDVDSLAALYNDELNCLLDRILPMRQCSSSVDSGRQTRGLTQSAAMQSVVHVASSVPTPRRTAE